jgi:hypothetical protein
LKSNSYCSIWPPSDKADQSSNITLHGSNTMASAELPTNIGLARISELETMAYRRPGYSEAERVAAAQELLAIYRSQFNERTAERRREIEAALLQAINGLGQFIFAQPDPCVAMARFLGAKQKRGKRAKNQARDFELSLEVEKYRRAGLSLEQALERISAESKNPILSTARIKNVHKRHKKEAAAEITLSQEGWGTRTVEDWESEKIRD